MTWWRIPTNATYNDIVELQEEIFFPTKRNDDWEKIEWKKMPKFFLELSTFYFDMLRDIDYHLCWDITLDEDYFNERYFALFHMLKPEFAKQLNDLWHKLKTDNDTTWTSI